MEKDTKIPLVSQLATDLDCTSTGKPGSVKLCWSREVLHNTYHTHPSLFLFIAWKHSLGT
jgi:hypothetical protein